jgi:hypothetical protein
MLDMMAPFFVASNDISCRLISAFGVESESVNDDQQLTQALHLLGEVLKQRGLAYDLVVIGGGALLLQNLIRRPTLDLDAVARVEGKRWVTAKPLPAPLVTAIREVALALGLERQPRDEKDWLNGGPAMLRDLGLPKGFAQRTTKRQFGALTIRVASRQDLVTLKLWAASDSARGQRRAVDISDLRALAVTAAELKIAARWCIHKDGRAEFAATDLAPVITALGFAPTEVIHE